MIDILVHTHVGAQRAAHVVWTGMPRTTAGDTLVDPTSGSQVKVISVEDGVVTLDLNARLAGEALTFEIEMVAINP